MQSWRQKTNFPQTVRIKIDAVVTLLPFHLRPFYSRISCYSAPSHTSTLTFCFWYNGAFRWICSFHLGIVFSKAFTSANNNAEINTGHRLLDCMIYIIYRKRWRLPLNRSPFDVSTIDSWTTAEFFMEIAEMMQFQLIYEHCIYHEFFAHIIV